MFWDVVVNTDSGRKGSFEKQKIKKFVSSVERVLCFTDFGHPGMMDLSKELFKITMYISFEIFAKDFGKVQRTHFA